MRKQDLGGGYQRQDRRKPCMALVLPLELYGQFIK